MRCATKLGQSLKESGTLTKLARLHFPSLHYEVWKQRRQAKEVYGNTTRKEGCFADVDAQRKFSDVLERWDIGKRSCESEKL